MVKKFYTSGLLFLLGLNALQVLCAQEVTPRQACADLAQNYGDFKSCADALNKKQSLDSIERPQAPNVNYGSMLNL